jgi:hypothetical protein
MRIEIDDDVPVIRLIEALAMAGLVIRNHNGGLRIEVVERALNPAQLALLLVEPANDQAV